MLANECDEDAATDSMNAKPNVLAKSRNVTISSNKQRTQPKTRALTSSKAKSNVGTKNLLASSDNEGNEESSKLGKVFTEDSDVASAGIDQADHFHSVSLNPYGNELEHVTNPILSEGSNGIGTTNEEGLKNLSLRFSLPIPQAPRTTSSLYTGSMYSTPGTFSISSRGCTSATAPSTTSTCSSVGSSQEKGLLGNSCINSNLSTGITTNNSMGNLSNGKSKTHQFSNVKTFTGNVPGLYSNPINMPFASSDCDELEDIDRIDNALLSALNDPREKIGLLRLEQTLIDFMNEKTTGYIEVGGPFNSIVIGGQSGGRLAATSKNVVNCLNVADGDGRNAKQTSFQRLCLHRLADRFNIERESATSTSSWSQQPSASSMHDDNRNSHYTSVPSVPGLIRLVKVKNSRIPKKLLINHDLFPYDTNDFKTDFPSCFENNQDKVFEKSKDEVRELNEQFGQTSLEKTNHVTFAKKQNLPKRIMKRNNESSSSLKSEHSNDRHMGKQKHRNSLKGKNMSDKEKAYAEARARIFNESFVSSENVDSNDKFCYAQEPVDCAGGSFIGTTQTPATIKTTKFYSPSSSVTPSEIGDEEYDRTNYNLTNGVSEIHEAETENSSTSTSKSQRDVNHTQSHVLPSVGNVASKVSWRNRRQEENDPDFRRGFGLNQMQGHQQYSYGLNSSNQVLIPGNTCNVQKDSYTSKMYNDSNINLTSHQNLQSSAGQYQRQDFQSPQVLYDSALLSQQFQSSNSCGSFGISIPQQHNYYVSNSQDAGSYYPHQKMRQEQTHHLQTNNNFNGAVQSNLFRTANGMGQPGFYNSTMSSGNSSNGPYSARRDGVLNYSEEFPALR